ncbi:hypothetical protein [Brevibacillus choshinensis]|uniref:hypothetical protein n=1 Tax=Brevibacillus choshinensis TaxID=54911 RepID=UPI002E22FF8B|nr:hypothetical protein [Brevibacillus choshinensis]
MSTQFAVSDRIGNTKTVTADSFEQAAILSGLSGPLRVIDVHRNKEARFYVHENTAVLIGYSK